MYDIEIHNAILEEPEEDALLPRARYPEKYKVSKATSYRGELLERCMLFLNYHNKRLFGIKTAHLSTDDLEWLLSISKDWKVNGPALFWKKIKESTPK